jgi:hypothetical protein
MDLSRPEFWRRDVDRRLESYRRCGVLKLGGSLTRFLRSLIF